jgi:hypothetical protein
MFMIIIIITYIYLYYNETYIGRRIHITGITRNKIGINDGFKEQLVENIVYLRKLFETVLHLL